MDSVALIQRQERTFSTELEQTEPRTLSPHEMGHRPSWGSQFAQGSRPSTPRAWSLPRPLPLLPRWVHSREPGPRAGIKG